MSWHVLILGHAFLFAISVICLRSVAKQKYVPHPSFVINAGFTIFFYLLGLATLPFLNPVNFSKLGPYLPWFIGGGIGFGLTSVCIYKLLSYLDAGISSVLGTLGVLFTILFAAVFLGEELIFSQVIGAALLLSSVYYVVMVARKPGKHRKMPKAWLWGLLFALLAGFFGGASIVNEKYLLGKMNVATYVLLGWGVQTLVALALAAIFQAKEFGVLLRPQVLRLAVVGGLARGGAGFLFLLSLIKSNNAALVSVVANFRLIIVVFLAAWLLKEHHKLKEKLIATAGALAGLVVIFWK